MSAALSRGSGRPGSPGLSLPPPASGLGGRVWGESSVIYLSLEE